MKQIDADRLHIDGNFKEFMESVRDEVDRLLNDGQEKDMSATIELDAQWYDFSEQDNFWPVPKWHSCIIWAHIKFGGTHFGIGDFEFGRYAGDRKRLDNLVKVRFVDALWSLADDSHQFNDLWVLQRLEWGVE